MKTIGFGIVSVSLVALAACGGATSDDGRDNARRVSGDSPRQDAGAQDVTAKTDAATGPSNNEPDDDAEDGDDDADALGNDTTPQTGAPPRPGDSDSAPGVAPPTTNNPANPVSPDRPPGDVGYDEPPRGVAVPPRIGGIYYDDFEDAPPPENCVTDYEASDVTYCEQSSSCDDDYAYAFCWDNGDGSWWCECGSRYGYRSYQLSGVTGAAACETTHDICTSGERPEFTEPAVCQDQYNYADGNFCETSRECIQSTEIADGVTAQRSDWQFAYCYDAGNGTYQCECNADGNYGTYLLEGVEGNGCEVALGICQAADGPPEFTEPAVCTDQYDYGDVGWCEKSRACTQSTEIGDGVTAQRSDWQSTYCYDQGVGGLICECSGSSVYQAYQVTGIDGNSACDLVLEECTSSGPVVFDGPVECQPFYQAASQRGCELSVQCGQVEQVANGIAAIQYSGGQYAYCSDQGNGRWRCECSDEAHYLRYDIDPSASGGDTCAHSLVLCAEAESLQAEGPIECTRNYQSAGQGWCETQLDCSQAAVISRTQIYAYGSLYTWCSENSPGDWSCDCGSGSSSATLRVSSSDGWDVCSQAADACPGLVDVVIGGGGYYGFDRPVGGVGVPVAPPSMGPAPRPDLAGPAGSASPGGTMQPMRDDDVDLK